MLRCYFIFLCILAGCGSNGNSEEEPNFTARQICHHMRTCYEELDVILNYDQCVHHYEALVIDNSCRQAIMDTPCTEFEAEVGEVWVTPWESTCYEPCSQEDWLCDEHIRTTCNGRFVFVIDCIAYCESFELEYFACEQYNCDCI